MDYKVFTSHLLPKKADKEAALSFLGCLDAVQWMVEFIEGMLDGMCSGSSACLRVSDFIVPD